ncbi:ubiquitin carboxyl-terminal hydrolase-domain-containing protein [Scheffersomyces coipomensis]|uniref:ubiquitin carboxyl-terminal hydrolase-domain-containing protein n=1 Tax=Scheffersomyces coipomensis TaxID=1788519 RepID=UPI00315CCDF9
MFGKDKKLQPVFDSHFWHWYIDSYARIPVGQLGDPTPYNKTKYYPASTSVVTVQKYFDYLKLPIPSAHQVIALLKSPFTQGDLVKTFHLVRFFQLSSDGLFLTNSGADKLGGVITYVGAENWENVMCYLDALLFSMFANLESFEPILFISNQTSDHLVCQLASLIRLYVNLLRSGNLITTDLTTRICEVLEKLGFREAMSHKQQDSAAIFDFLTETLSMPLLTFKIDIKHGGKFNKEDDQKISKERILFVSIPDEEGESYVQVDKDQGSTEITEHQIDQDQEHDGILLEECLEQYFNNSISVKRELERRATLESLRESGAMMPATSISNPGGEILYYGATIPEENSIQSFSASEATLKRNSGSNQIDNLDEAISLRSSTPISRARSDSYKGTQVRYATRTRSSTVSLWSSNDNDPSRSKEVSLPAWMFLTLLPFYTDDNNMVGPESIARNSKEFVNRRPILPICLKRYSYDSSSSSATRSKKRIIIPPFIDLPQFVADDVDDETPGNYRLILESAVCHRGNSINSGHFISVVRKDSDNVNMTEEEGHTATWYLYDDMKKKSRIVEKSFAEIFNTEWPYMLFYRLVTSQENFTANKSSPVTVPHGSKPKYWAEETLSPIISASNTDDESRSLKRLESAVSSTSSIPIPDIPPTDPRSIDIRQRYYWYVVDKDKNYYKELPSVSKYGNSNGSVTLSPQFRRNSQWSEKSAVSSIHNLMHSNVNDVVIEKSSADAVNEKLKEVNISSPKEDSKSKKSPLTSFLSPTSSHKVKPTKSPKTLEKPNSSTTTSNTTSPRRSPTTTTTKPTSTAPPKKHHHFHRKSKKSEEYKKDKCIIT